MREHARKELADVDGRQLLRRLVIDDLGIRKLVADRAGEKLALDVHDDSALRCADVPLLFGHHTDGNGPRVVRNLRQAELVVVDPQQLGNEGRRHDPHQAFLRLADRDYFGRHVFDRDVDFVEIDLRAVTAVPGHLRRTADDAAGAEILEGRLDAVLVQRRKGAVARAHQNVFQKRIGNLHRSLVELRIAGVERQRRERCAAEPAGSVALPTSTIVQPAAPLGA